MHSNGLDWYRTVGGSTIRLAIAIINGLLFGLFLTLLLGGLIIFFLVLLAGYFLVYFPKVFLACWVSYQIFKIWRQANLDKEFQTKIWISNVPAVIFLVSLFIIPFTIHHILVTPTHEQQEYGDYKKCYGEFADHLPEDKKTRKDLEGGWREFQGQKFKIQTCAKIVNEESPGFSFRGSNIWHYKVRVAIFNEQGGLQSLGYFKSGTDSLFSFEIEGDQIEYGDWDGFFSRTIKMPPSRFERFRSRLPSWREDILEEQFPFWIFNL